ncbi:hypothetical protein EMPS_03012 [Entomortierella parvispora]|uniref:TLC domain-containing protein n=1 Tax=Entomortierella parvispora TaxID=205924 RepID=A0A9P3H5Y0_9FUNG|nr:hypothetical protein EMPS_03012 [Entomortierella parvispora]
MPSENSAVPSETVQGMLQFITEIAAEIPSGPDRPLMSNMEAPVDSIFGIELTPPNILLFRALIFSFFFQPVLLYSTWFLFPDLGKNRKRLSWTLTFFCAVLLVSTGIAEVGHVRLTIYSFLGWDKIAGPDATLFSYWTPTLHKWILQFRSGKDDQNAISTIKLVTTIMSYRTSDSWASFQDSITLAWEQLVPLLLDAETWKGLLGCWMRWVVSLPIFSLKPLEQPQLFSVSRPYLLGGGGRVLFSLESYPRDNWFISILSGYFVGYCLGDLVLGLLHYRKELDPASGWMHHTLYVGLVFKVAQKGQLGIFLAAGALLEVPTIFLASGNMFPHLREDFWFPLTFFIFRIVFVAGMLHEVTFNYPIPWEGVFVYFLALSIHVFWFVKYLKGRKRRALRAQKVKQEALERQKEQEQVQEQQDRGESMALMSPSLPSEKSLTALENEMGDVYSTGVASLAGHGGANTIQLRPKNSVARA